MRAYRKYLLTMAAVWGASTLILTAVYLLLLSPQQEKRKLLEQQITEKKQQYDSAVVASQEENKRKMRQEVLELQQKLHDFLIDSQDYANLAFDISRIADDRKLNSFTTKAVDQVEATKKDANKYVQENKFDIRFESSFVQFATFLNELERHRPIVFVDAFKISRSQESDVAHKTEMNVAVMVRKRQEG